MLSRICRVIKAIGRCRSGNTGLLVALGMPVLLGGVGMGVDVAQWYMWKRELQYAVDQAAMAGAWAQTDAGTKGIFTDRAKQEFTANLSVLKGDTSVPTVGLVNFGTGNNNAVEVSATTSRELPFSSFFMDAPATIRAKALAKFSEGATYTSCLIALDEDETGAVTINGSTILTAGCGLAALSTAAEAISVDGNPTIDAGWIVAAGGIDPWLKANTDDIIMEYMSGLYDPFEELTPPNPAESQINRTYQCVKGKRTTRANVATGINTTYTYWKGESYETAVSTTYNKSKNPSTSSTSTSYTIVANDIVEGQIVSTTTTKWTAVNGSSKNTVWEKETTVTSKNYSSVSYTDDPDAATVYPGVYSNIMVGCTTVFTPGVYVIDGGGLKITGQYEVTGHGVMFVLKNGAWIDIEGGANINLTAMLASDLIARGVTTANANKLAGMLVFESRDSQGSSKTKINGNAATLLNGTIYLPVSTIDFAGTASVSSQCLMIAAAQIKLTGNANMTTFCPANKSSTVTVVNTAGTVTLVA